MADYLDVTGTQAPLTPGATNTQGALGLGLPRLNGNSISGFLRQQLAERTQTRRAAQPRPPMTAASLLFGEGNGG